MVGRNFYSLVVLTPGVTGLPTGGSQGLRGNRVDVFIPEYGVNMNAGGRAEQNRFSLDSSNVTSMVRGGVVNITPNAESIQELRVSVNNFSAENGSGAGASVTRSPSREPTSCTAAPASTTRATGCRFANEFTNALPVFRRNEWTGTSGGPIIRNKTFASSRSICSVRASPTAACRREDAGVCESADHPAAKHHQHHAAEEVSGGGRSRQNFLNVGRASARSSTAPTLRPVPSTPITTPIGNCPAT